MMNEKNTTQTAKMVFLASGSLLILAWVFTDVDRGLLIALGIITILLALIFDAIEQTFN